ncbi:MAG: pyruvate ferredoxin oxidoreductase, partial [Planctomycetota bacterium]
MTNRAATTEASAARFPGLRSALDGGSAVVAMETAASEAAGAYPITPSTQMGEGWAAAMAAGRANVDGRQLIFFEPEGEHAAAAVTAGMSLAGLRATNFSSGQGIAYMHESLYAAVGKRLTYVLNVACRAMTKQALNVHAGHDDYHAVDDSGFFQVFAKDVQGAADLNLIAHRVAELSLNPGICAQDGFLTSHVIETLRLPERALIRAFLGSPADMIESPTPAQRLVFGERRRRIPELFDLDNPAMLGVVQNQESYAQGVAAQRPFYFDHVAELADRAFDEYARLTGRRYARASGYRLDDADYAIVGQGSVVANAEVVVDHLRETRGLKLGVLDLTMFRPFPADLVSRLLSRCKAALVLERVDQPLAVDAPLLRELRAAMGQALENGRARGELPFPGLAACRPEQVPDFYSGCFGLGSCDLQPQDIVAAVENMLPQGGGRRRFYLGFDFVREDSALPKLQIWQQRLLASYPDLAGLSLSAPHELDLMPAGSTSIRIHSVGGWGAITMGKNLALTAAELLGLHVKANPKYGSEKKGQPTTFFATLAHEPLRLNCDLKHVDVVLSPDPGVFQHSDPLAGLSEGGVFVIQHEGSSEQLWQRLPSAAQRSILERKLRVFHLHAFGIAADEASDPELRHRMQGAAFMGAFFRASHLLAEAELGEQQLMDGIRAQLRHKFGQLGPKVVADNERIIRRGFDELQQLDTDDLLLREDEPAKAPCMPFALVKGAHCQGLANAGRFWEQVGSLYADGQDGIADPFAASSVIPAATSSMRDMTAVRFEVPRFLPDKCTGCSQCWVQCPDSAIPGVVNSVDEVITAAIEAASGGEGLERMRQATRQLARESRKIMKGAPFHSFAEVLKGAYERVASKLAPDPERRAELDRQFAAVYPRLDEFPLARTAPFFELPEGKHAGDGGLLSITVNPRTCKGCAICVDVCPDGALVMVDQDEALVEQLRSNWELWRLLPDTDERYINVASVDQAIGVLPSLLLKKEVYRSLLGGDGACSGCSEKTVLHLVTGAVTALMRPRVQRHVAHIDELILGLDKLARELLASDADLDALSAGRAANNGARVDIELEPAKRARVERITATLTQLRDLRWRYEAGPGGQGRALMGMANSTGCSSVWGSTYPFNPYPFPWVSHLFQDAPSLAIGIFEAHMRKLADGFVSIRRAELELAGEYDAERHEPFLARFDWQQFSDEEFAHCPPLLVVGGDGAMLDIGFQNLSRLMASGKPLRVIVLDTQAYSNTGGQACTSSYAGQISDMAAFGEAQHGKQETRKELALIAMAHRGVFVLQSSQASASHLLGGVLRGLQSRRPALFLLNCPCPPEHGIADDAATRAARLALESRAFPLLVFDPDGGPALSDCLELDGNPALHQTWPRYELSYQDADGQAQTMELPLTIADWAASEARFKRHFSA